MLRFNIATTAALVFGLATFASAQTPQPAPTTPATPTTTTQTQTTPGQTGPGAGENFTGTTTTPTWEVSFGYQAVRGSDQTFPFGLNVDGARNFGTWGLVGELGFARDSTDVLGSDINMTLWNVGAGPRWSWRGAGRVWPFAQVLVGAAHARASVETAGVEISDSDSRFMVQPGIGVNVLGGDGWGIVGQVDYRRVFTDEDETGSSGENQVRFFVGLRLVID